MTPYAQVAVPIPLNPLGARLDYRILPEQKDFVQPGSLVNVPFRNKTIWGVVMSLSQEPSVDIDPKKIKPLGDVKFEEPVFDETGLKFLSWLSTQYFYPIGEVAEAMIPAAVRKGTQKTLQLKETASPKKKTSTQTSISPNADQARALEQIWTDPRGHLLWGITGSGKTQVYIEAIRKCLSKGKGAMILVPEISLTPQLLSRFEAAFPNQIAVFHSAQKPTELRRAWLEVFHQVKPIALGARSALFAPIKNLGLIVLDEEHDSSYKQDERLKYHARESAEELAKLRGSKLLLGSATPSAESLYKTMTGAWALSKLENRAAQDSVLPTIHLVDLKKQLPEKNLSIEAAATAMKPNEPLAPESFFLSSLLHEKITDRLQKKEQVILFLNRRGIGSNLLCRSCGDSIECPTCHVALTPHRQTLLCHYCGHQCKEPKECVTCGAGEYPYKKVGIGTQEVENLLGVEFPEAKVLRLDRDSASTKNDLEKILDLFAQGEGDILIGTQMVAKGHDFAKVTLVGMILADMGLHVPDFRAAEKSLQLLLQVSGRAGRSSAGGEVVVQTFNPDHRVFRALSTYSGLNSYSEFLSVDLLEREALGYPPYGELVLMRFDGLDENQVRSAANAVAVALSRVDQAYLQVLGPVTSFYSRVRGRHRYNVLLKSKSREHLSKSIEWIWEVWMSKRLETKYKTRLSLDVSPISMS
jgi:primosomal protein N' (replication factor Y) (superfamily II helicase)